MGLAAVETRSETGSTRSDDGLLMSDTRCGSPLSLERPGAMLIDTPPPDLPPRILSALRWRILPLLWLAFASVSGTRR